jgi:hypothetical protein
MPDEDLLEEEERDTGLFVCYNDDDPSPLSITRLSSR